MLRSRRAVLITGSFLVNLCVLFGFQQGTTFVAIPAGFHQVPQPDNTSKFVADASSDVTAHFAVENTNTKPEFYLAGIYSRFLCNFMQQKLGCVLPAMPDTEQINGITVVNGNIMPKELKVFYTFAATSGDTHGWYVFTVPIALMPKYITAAKEFQELWWTRQMYPQSNPQTSNFSAMSPADRLAHLRALQIVSSQYWRNVR